MTARNAWHFITAEYPPQCGGVGDFCRHVAEGLAAEGDEVHVWCRRDDACEGGGGACAGVQLHRELNRFGVRGLWRLGRMLNAYPRPRRLMLQWVPHGFGFHSMNVMLCAWLLFRTRVRGDVLELIVHEPGLELFGGTWRQTVAASMHRLMTILLLAASTRVWMSIPGWEKYLRPYALGRRLPFDWLPIPSNIPLRRSPDADAAATRVRLECGDEPIVGHFGTYGRYVGGLLERILPELLRANSSCAILLMGAGSAQWRDRFAQQHPDFAGRIRAAGPLGAEELSGSLAACDVLLQPYYDGINNRHGSAMAGLAHGKPLVTNSGHLTEPFWFDCGAVAIAQQGPEMLSKIVEDAMLLLASPERRMSMGRAASELYQEKFDVRHAIAKLRDAARESSSRHTTEAASSPSHQCA